MNFTVTKREIDPVMGFDCHLRNAVLQIQCTSVIGLAALGTAPIIIIPLFILNMLANRDLVKDRNFAGGMLNLSTSCHKYAAII